MSENRQIVSMRIEDSKLEQIQVLAARLYIRESDLYQFAVSYTLNKLTCLMDNRYSGSDLLPLLLDIREDINKNLNINKHLLFKIVNTPPNKYVDMIDIELLLTPTHLIKEYLHRLGEKTQDSENAEACLKLYIFKKYNLALKKK